MLKEKSYSSYIIPVHDGKIALLRYGQDGYGPIGGRLDDGENFNDAMRRELTEELGKNSVKLLDLTTEIPVAYSFTHTDPKRAEKRGAWSEEHHFVISHETANLDLTFCEKRNEDISVVWLDATSLINPEIIQIAGMREFFAKHIIPNLGCRFSMSVRNKYFGMIKSGIKDIELRVYDEKRKRMKVGDRFLLYDAENPTEYIICEILNMHIAPDFGTLFTNIDIKRSEFHNMNELIDTVTKFISREKLQREQIVGIEIKRIR